MMMLKAFTWSPFIGWEYYDLLFEHLYMDTQYQLNQIRPGEEFIKSLASPLSHKSIRAIATVEENQSGSKVASSQKVNFVGFDS